MGVKIRQIFGISKNERIIMYGYPAFHYFRPCGGLHAHARCHPEGGGNGGKHGDDDVENLSPNAFTFHFLVDS